MEPQKNEKNGACKLNLGCGRMILPGFINVDIMPLPGVDITWDLNGLKKNPLPFADGSVSEILCSHTLEHIDSVLDFMQDLHRVAQSGARAVFKVPYGSSDAAFEDPTHVRAFFLHSFEYFAQPCYWRADYGYRGDWKTEKIELLVDARKLKDDDVSCILDAINTRRNTVIEMTAVLSAVKPIRSPDKSFKSSPKLTVVLQKDPPASDAEF
jgi:SAM-dependent methyltransferase